jgi:hypothetical protein
MLHIVVEFGKEHAVNFGEHNRFISAFGGIVGKAGFYGQHHYTVMQGQPDARVVFSATFRMEAERPKEIPDKEFMLSALGGEEVMKSTFTRYAELAEEYTKMYEHEEEVKRQANNIVRHFTEEACAEAKKVVRYEQRMAALQAEYVAEVEAVVKANMNDWKATLVKDNDVITEAIKLGMEHVPAHAVGAAKKTGVFRSGNTDPVKYDVATIDEWLEEKGHVDQVVSGSPTVEG